MIKTNFSKLILITSLLISGCSTFIPDKDSDMITLKYQAGEYILLQDLSRNNKVFPKDSVVKLLVVTSDDWVKIYAYNSSEKLLESNRLLLLYLFEDDFPDKKFSQEYLDNQLLKLVKLNDSTEQPKKESKKEKKKVKK